MYFSDASGQHWVLKQHYITKVDDPVIDTHPVMYAIKNQTGPQPFLPSNCQQDPFCKCTILTKGDFYLLQIEFRGNTFLVKTLIDHNINAIYHILFRNDVPNEDESFSVQIKYVPLSGKDTLTTYSAIYLVLLNEKGQCVVPYPAKEFNHRIKVDEYTYVIGGYIKTDDFVYHIESKRYYDEIYPNMFDSIVESKGRLYIQGTYMADQLADFNFGFVPTKSARSV